jgi:uncharacterized protein RhaS with RHS repeats
VDLQHPVELNRYGYVANNPVNAVDPSGLLATTGYISANQVNASARPMVYVTGLAVACVYRLTASYLATALGIALFGGTFQFNSGTAPCTFQRKPITCDDDHYKLYARCDHISGKYNIEGKGDREGIELARVLLSKTTVALFKKQATNDPLDVCTGTPNSWHWEVKNANGKGYYTSIKECTCCEEVGR